MSATRPYSFVRCLMFLLGAYSLAIPVIITPIALARLSAANHGHPVFGWALFFYLSGLVPGALSLIGIWKLKRHGMLWLPLLGISFCGALAFIAFFFWAMSGMNIQ